MKIKRSPFFYVGDKYRLMTRMLELFPSDIGRLYEPFVGGGTVAMNVRADKYLLNDVNPYVIKIHKFLSSSAPTQDAFFSDVYNLVRKYGMSFSYKKDIIPDSLKQQYKKTYYAQFNKNGYVALRADTNARRLDDSLALYVLMIYGFNRMIRLNGQSQFNLPVGNVDFNGNYILRGTKG